MLQSLYNGRSTDVDFDSHDGEDRHTGEDTDYSITATITPALSNNRHKTT